MCCSSSSSTTTSGVPPTSSVTSTRASRSSSILPTRSSSTWMSAGVTASSRRSSRDAHPCRPRLGARPACARARSSRCRVHEAAGAAFPHESLQDGGEIELGEVVIRALHTPGHRPEHCAFADRRLARGRAWLCSTATRSSSAMRRVPISRSSRSRAPKALPLATAARGARRRRRGLSGYVAGSLCGAAHEREAVDDDRVRAPLQPRARRDLRRLHRECERTEPPRPPNMEAIVELNRGPSSVPSRRSRTSTYRRTTRWCSTCERRAFTDGHRMGAVNVPVSGSAFGTRAAFVLSERAVVIDAADEQRPRTRRAGCARSASSTSSAGARVAETSGSSL